MCCGEKEVPAKEIRKKGTGVVSRTFNGLNVIRLNTKYGNTTPTSVLIATRPSPETSQVKQTHFKAFDSIVIHSAPLQKCPCVQIDCECNPVGVLFTNSVRIE